MEYRNILLILLLIFLLIQYRNRSLIEGIGENNEGTPSLEPLDLDDEDDIENEEIDDTIEECKAVDVLENKNGYCNLEEGDVIGSKTNGDISDCRCECKDGYSRNNLLNIDSDVNSCIINDNITSYDCFQECRNRINLLREGEYSKKEICEEIKKIDIDCGRKCTLEGGGTIKSHNLLHKNKYSCVH